MGNDPPTGPGAGNPDWGKLKTASGADRMILIAGLVFFIDSFLPWYGFSIQGFGSANVSGWSAGGLAVLSILFAIAATAFAAVRVMGMKVSLGGAKDGMVYMVLGIGALAFAVLRLITETSLTKFGLYIAIAAGAVLAYGGWMKNKKG